MPNLKVFTYKITYSIRSVSCDSGNKCPVLYVLVLASF